MPILEELLDGTRIPMFSNGCIPSGTTSTYFFLVFSPKEGSQLFLICRDRKGCPRDYLQAAKIKMRYELQHYWSSFEIGVRNLITTRSRNGNCKEKRPT